MKHAIRTATAFAFTSLCLCASADAKIVTFQIPGAHSIRPNSMNGKGQVAGWYDDTQTGTWHAFLLQPGGAVTTFDVPDAKDTVSRGISPDGVVVGWYDGPWPQTGGFIRATDGTLTTFTAGPSTLALGTNAKGWIVGEYNRNHQRPYQPFLRDPSGAIKEFWVPGATEGVGTMVVNRSRTIAGNVLVPAGGYQGFFRASHGPAALFGDHHGYTDVAGINDAGTVAGSFQDQHSVAFVRTSDGAITTFVGPNGATDAYAYAINNSGTIAGTFADSSGVGHGYLRAADGTFTSFDIAGAANTEIRAINDKGAIAGVFTDPHGQYFGFAGKP